MKYYCCASMVVLSNDAVKLISPIVTGKCILCSLSMIPNPKNNASYFTRLTSLLRKPARTHNTSIRNVAQTTSGDNNMHLRYCTGVAPESKLPAIKNLSEQNIDWQIALRAIAANHFDNIHKNHRYRDLHIRLPKFTEKAPQQKENAHIEGFFFVVLCCAENIWIVMAFVWIWAALWLI